MCKIIIFFFLGLAHTIFAQTITVNGPTGSGAFSTAIVMLTNGNYVVTDPLYDEAGVQDIGAVYLYNGDTHTLISTLKGSTTADKVGSSGILVLNNGNFVVLSANWNNSTIPGVGAATWVNGVTGLNTVVSSSNSLVGSSTADFESGSIKSLANGNYLVVCPLWNNASVEDVGAVAWGNGAMGTSGVMSPTNSLVGTAAFDNIGITGVRPLSNSNYVIISKNWDNGLATNAGAVTWGNGIMGIIGSVNSSNSLVGSATNDRVGDGFEVLKNSNYVVLSKYWSNGTIASVGAATLGNGSTGITGIINSTNSLVGSTANDQIGSGIAVLSNDNYLIRSDLWDNGSIMQAGAVTWCNGNAATVGVISSANSLVGSSTNDKVGNGGIYELSNGNYVISSKVWNNGAIEIAGATTWGNGTIGISGIISATNSLVGASVADQVGSIITILNNGNYVVTSSFWDNGGIIDAGASTWGNGNTGVIGVVSTSNSLVGSHESDNIGVPIALNNGNYVIRTTSWDNGAAINVGAATWANGATGITGTINNTNSLIGATVNNFIGSTGIFELSNGNFVVVSAEWDNGSITNTGAVTWGNGNSGTFGIVNDLNSLIGSKANDKVGNGGINNLPNGNYLVNSPVWDLNTTVDVGAVTWLSGSEATSGVVSSSNSLIGSTANDNVGFRGIQILPNNNYVVLSPDWNNGSVVDAGAVTWGNGSIGVVGQVSSTNSLVGGFTGDQVGSNAVIVLTNSNYVVRSPNWDNGSATNAGAITWGSGIAGIIGNVSVANSLVGSTINDQIGSSGVFSLINGNYVVTSNNWDNGSIVNAAAATWGNGSIGTNGVINSCNSILGNTPNAIGFSVNYDSQFRYYLIGKPNENRYYIFNPAGQLVSNHLDNLTTTIAGNTTTPLVTNNCRIIASLAPNGMSPIAGNITAKTWIEATQPTTYVKRHYEISPTIGAGSATAKITLYFTQANFSDYNNQMPAPLMLLPTGPTDATGKANLKVEKFDGTSSSGTGLPNTYTGETEMIDPVDTDIVWNSLQNRWEISFDVIGFSGFFVTSQNISLPITLISFSGKRTDNGNELIWKTSNETNFSHFEIERSSPLALNGGILNNKFEKIGEVKSNNNSIERPEYKFTDKKNSSLIIHNSSLFYRLRMVDLDGKFSYSKIISIENETGDGISIYPNPSSDYFSITKNQNIKSIEMVDLTGKIIKKMNYSADNHYSISGLPKGIYYLKLNIAGKIKISKIAIN